MAELVHYIAVNGENYDGYARFATSRGWRLYSKRYLHNWVGRHRSAIKVEREHHLYDLRKQSLLDKSTRLAMLERSSQALERRLEAALNSDDDELAVKLAEQMRKQLQAVATERGEWNTKEDNRNMEGIKNVLLERMQQAALPDPDVVEGIVTELDA